MEKTKRDLLGMHEYSDREKELIDLLPKLKNQKNWAKIREIIYRVIDSENQKMKKQEA